MGVGEAEGRKEEKEEDGGGRGGRRRMTRDAVYLPRC